MKGFIVAAVASVVALGLNIGTASANTESFIAQNQQPVPVAADSPLCLNTIFPFIKRLEMGHVPRGGNVVFRVSMLPSVQNGREVCTRKSANGSLVSYEVTSVADAIKVVNTNNGQTFYIVAQNAAITRPRLVLSR